jgi:hypothetical protein
MNAPITGPSDRLYGKVIELSTKRVNGLPFAKQRSMGGEILLGPGESCELGTGVRPAGVTGG